MVVHLTEFLRVNKRLVVQTGTLLQIVFNFDLHTDRSPGTAGIFKYAEVVVYRWQRLALSSLEADRTFCSNSNRNRRINYK
jgi:hypothetical protein